MHTLLTVLFDEVQSLDVTGPLEVFTGANTWRTHHGDGPVYDIRAGRAAATCRVRTSSWSPAAPASNNQMQDGPVHEWLRTADQVSAWTTLVCTGSLILAAAGLLSGRRATSHWLALDELGRLGATPVSERVVADGKYVTAVGVSSGIDMGLALASWIAGDEVAQAIQLMNRVRSPSRPTPQAPRTTPRPRSSARLRARSRFLLTARPS